MTNNYWTDEKKETLINLVKQGKTLEEILVEFPLKSSMSLIFEVRSLSSLGNIPSRDEKGKERVRDQRLSKREAYPDSNRPWEEGDVMRLKEMFLQEMCIDDIYLALGRTYTSLFSQMEKLYPKPADRQELFEKVAFFIRFKPLKENTETEVKPLNEQVTMAVQLAAKVHATQVDKGGHPYILHPMRVATKCKTLEGTVAALLHDVLEDTSTSADDLLEMGFSREIVIAVQALTKREGEDYFDFVLRAKQNPIAKEVNEQDIRDNMDLTRIPKPTETDFDRCRKYMKALWMLTHD